ncbi:LamB/YcsF family protein [Coralliovum pocilloporae]|uniref:LamB/YcsF family protein n=1 Tax=Coralliovum pocilloporae TaxID=3066369 RepID=UPI003306CAAC
MTSSIDLNVDLGESYGPWVMGHDAEMLDIVTSANVACGFHAGDPQVMDKTIRMCQAKGVGIGAHPGFRDLHGFGRYEIQGIPHDVLSRDIIYQIGAIQAMARVNGAHVRHVKLHGAFANMASRDKALADMYVEAARAVDPDLYVVAMASTALEKATLEQGGNIAREVFADRAYNDDGTLVSRSVPGSVIHDADMAADRVLKMIDDQAVTSINGVRTPVKPETICVHGDNPAAVAMASALRNRLEKAGIAVKMFGS